MTDQELNKRFDQIIEIFERRFEQVDKRFEQVDRRFEQVDRRFEQVDKRFEEVEKRLDENVELARSVETSLLKEFRKWAISFESRFKANEILIGGFNERLIALEERVGDIERRSPNGRA
jgi:phage shock protein A